MALSRTCCCPTHATPIVGGVQGAALLLVVRGRALGWDPTVATDNGLREVLPKFIADFANWDNAVQPEYLGPVDIQAAEGDFSLHQLTIPSGPPRPSQDCNEPCL